MEVENWQLAVGGAAAAGGVGLVGIMSQGVRDVIAGIFRLMLTWLDRKEKHLASNATEVRQEMRANLYEIAEWASIVRSIQALPFVTRALVFSGSNGGGVPRAGKKFIVKCFYGLPPETWEKYRGPLLVDEHYIRMLADMLEHGFKQVKTAELHAEAMLRYYYESEGVTESLFFLLGCEPTEITFCSIANSTGFVPAQIAQVRMIVDRARALIGTGLEHQAPAQ